MQARADLERDIMTMGERLAQTLINFKESEKNKKYLGDLLLDKK